MGMGEPLHNYQAVVSAVRAMVDQRRFALAPSHVTVSTVGIVPYMLRLSQDLPAVNLALSLHAPTQELRETIVPSAKQYPLPSLIDALAQHQTRTKKKVLIEYIMIDSVNDTPEQAHQLGVLLKDFDVHINLIPYNPTLATPHFHAPKSEHVQRFQHILYHQYGLATTTRVTMGQDVDGACGQLALQTKENEKQMDIEDVVPNTRAKGLKERRNNNTTKKIDDKSDKQKESNAQTTSKEVLQQNAVNGADSVNFRALLLVVVSLLVAVGSFVVFVK
eukprot:c8428_g1_i1.p1 GENE.c8428_g1_i1~~c8428_g1_i1.p1  ORF type:complete len:276 (+),score=61.53 c8428_g1_i1:474-1301(+)